MLHFQKGFGTFGIDDAIIWLFDYGCIEYVIGKRWLLDGATLQWCYRLSFKIRL